MDSKIYGEVTLEEFEGFISKIHYKKDDFIIATFTTSDKNVMKIKGSLYGVEKKENIRVSGAWEYHSQYGNQFSVVRWERPMPVTKNQTIAFLSSSLVKGCSANNAKKIVEQLGEHAIEVINQLGVAAFKNIRGIGPKRSSQIVDSLRSTFEVQRIISALLTYGITVNMSMKAYKKFGADTLHILEKNPYKLIEIDLVGFLKADEIAKKIGIMPLSTYRIDACVEFVLKNKCFNLGHCFINEEELYTEVLRALNHNSLENDVVTLEDIQQSIYRLEDKKIVIEENRVYPKFLFQYEEKLAENLSLMNDSTDGEALSFLDSLIIGYQRKHQIILAEKQREAIHYLFKKQLLILTGGPGTGKTTVIKTMLNLYRNLHPKATIALVAPTGRASRKLSEVTEMEASTIHKLIGYRQGEKPLYNAQNKLPVNFLIIDEMSMVDLQLASLLIDALDKNTKILFVGDIDQLPSVNPGNVLKDLIDAGLPTVKLTQVFRQSQESQIVTNAHRINKGKPLLINKEKNDFYFIESECPNQIAQLIVLSIARFINLGYSLSDILVLSPMKKGPVGTQILNEMIREFINPLHTGLNEWLIGKKKFREGDKVIQIKNNDQKKLSNGDIGIVLEITREKNANGDLEDIMICNFSGRKVTFYKEELNQIELGYVITIHKSQGGESPIVIIPVTTSHYVMLARNLIYTGLTRAKNIMVFIGSHKAMHIAIANDKIAKRNSRLAERIIHHIRYNNRFKTQANLFEAE
ncbi:ATP-dependent RecD-like DNA helicase [Lysinibacillus sphaericus]|uniref:SF1B family DNA helicase RecD2 n=1 Tax=Lysinibacillus sphaericus TaxID=1421 RepID=UPI001E4265D3|nr:ATP-dependent RecD-like DNA helicase [Lysinibacillus sphaericus]UDK97039.1 ATP-dependent RecD-like DNA helicase [Lysinibacillus sphaericus]